MRTHLIISSTRLLSTLVLLFSGSVAIAAYQELKHPWIARPKDYSADDYKKIEAVLAGKDCKFLGGSALNGFTSLRYHSDTIALNKFIEALAECPNVVVSVNFYRPSPGAPECDWMVTHEPYPMKFVVRVNLESKNIKLEKLYLPPVTPERPAASKSGGN